MHFESRVGLLIAIAAIAACAEDLRADLDAGVDAPADARVTHVDHEDGTTTTTVVATDETDWVYVGLAARRTPSPAEPEASRDWDLGVQRFRIKLNGGVSGPGGVELAALPGADFAAMVIAPVGPYVSDAADSAQDDDDQPDLAFLTGEGLWYDYDPATHQLTPRDQVYVLRGVDGGYVKLRILSYYDDAGTPGHLAFQWAPIEAPSVAATAHGEGH